MDSKTKSIFSMKVNSKLDNMFRGIIEDIPTLENSGSELALIQKGELISYEGFYNILYKCVLEYIPKKNENPLIKAIVMLPRAIKNVKRIAANSEIIEFQRKILNDYFYMPGKKNIKEKVNELKNAIDELIEVGDYQILEDVLENFENRIRNDFLKDMEKLADLLKKRN